MCTLIPAVHPVSHACYVLHLKQVLMTDTSLVTPIFALWQYVKIGVKQHIFGQLVQQVLGFKVKSSISYPSSDSSNVKSQSPSFFCISLVEPSGTSGKSWGLHMGAAIFAKSWLVQDQDHGLSKMQYGITQARKCKLKLGCQD